jgi:hypothetical protein
MTKSFFIKVFLVLVFSIGATNAALAREKYVPIDGASSEDDESCKTPLSRTKTQVDTRGVLSSFALSPSTPPVGLVHQSTGTPASAAPKAGGVTPESK